MAKLTVENEPKYFFELSEAEAKVIWVALGLTDSSKIPSYELYDLMAKILEEQGFDYYETKNEVTSG